MKNNKINNKQQKLNKDTEEMLLSTYLAGEIEIIKEIYDLSIYDLNFIRSFFWNNPVKKEKNIIKKIDKFIDKQEKQHIDNLIDLIEEDEKETLEKIIKRRVMIEWYDYEEDDIRDIQRHETMFRNKLEEELYFIAGYLKEKLTKKFITKRISKENISLKLLIKKHNQTLANLKYLFYKL